MAPTGPDRGRIGLTPLAAFVFWCLLALPAAALVALVVRSEARKSEFARLASGRADGTVVRLVERRGKNLTRVPVVAFSTPDGRRFEFTSRFGDMVAFGQTRFSPGGRFPVVYVPAEPARAEIDDPSLRAADGGWLVTGSLAWIALWTLVFGGLGWAGRARSPRANAPPFGPVAPS